MRLFQLQWDWNSYTKRSLSALAHWQYPFHCTLLASCWLHHWTQPSSFLSTYEICTSSLTLAQFASQAVASLRHSFLPVWSTESVKRSHSASLVAIDFDDYFLSFAALLHPHLPRHYLRLLGSHLWCLWLQLSWCFPRLVTAWPGQTRCRRARSACWTDQSVPFPSWISWPWIYPSASPYPCHSSSEVLLPRRELRWSKGLRDTFLKSASVKSSKMKSKLSILSGAIFCKL